MGIPVLAVDNTKHPIEHDNGHWQFEQQMCLHKEIGFVYLIVDLMNKKFYLGKKNYKGMKGATKGKESNWRSYVSSSIELSERIKLYGKDYFDFHVIEEYTTKSGLNYAEVWSLINVEANYDRNLWYNLLIEKVSYVVKERVTPRHKNRLEILVETYKELFKEI